MNENLLLWRESICIQIKPEFGFKKSDEFKTVLPEWSESAHDQSIAPLDALVRIWFG